MLWVDVWRRTHLQKLFGCMRSINLTSEPGLSAKISTGWSKFSNDRAIFSLLSTLASCMQGKRSFIQKEQPDVCLLLRTTKFPTFLRKWKTSVKKHWKLAEYFIAFVKRAVVKSRWIAGPVLSVKASIGRHVVIDSCVKMQDMSKDLRSSSENVAAAMFCFNEFKFSFVVKTSSRLWVPVRDHVELANSDRNNMGLDLFWASGQVSSWSPYTRKHLNK